MLDITAYSLKYGAYSDYIDESSFTYYLLNRRFRKRSLSVVFNITREKVVPGTTIFKYLALLVRETYVQVPPFYC